MPKIKQINTLLKPKVFIAMSGGVDSSVAAALLKKQGFDVTGVFFKPWSPSGKNFCDWKQERQDAMRAAAVLNIKFKTWDFSKEYGKKVVSYMIDSYKKGLTPNPDVMCNKEIKFGLFWRKAKQEGADFIATGHYIKSAKSKNSFKLLMSRDKQKDQSYFLWALEAGLINKCLFPIGDYKKSEVRKLAKRFGLANFDKKDSQGVCFVGQLNMKKFLQMYIRKIPGTVVTLKGETIGRHDGVFYYTIGQRHGLDLKIGGGPFYVVRKDLKKNIIFVSKNVKDLNSQNITVKNLNWLIEKGEIPSAVSARIRYRGRLLTASLSKVSRKGELKVSFKKPAKAPASGQSVVFYKGQRLLGGGIISKLY